MGSLLAPLVGFGAATEIAKRLDSFQGLDLGVIVILRGSVQPVGNIGEDSSELLNLGRLVTLEAALRIDVEGLESFQCTFRIPFPLRNDGVAAEWVEKIAPGGYIWEVTEDGTAFAFRHTAPNTKFHARIEGIGTTLDEDRAITATQGGGALGGTFNEKGITTIFAAEGVCDPFRALPRVDSLALGGD